MTEVQWLDSEEQAAWRAFLFASQMLDEALDRQLQRDAGLPHAYYGILVALSEAPGRTLRMTELARLRRHSPSRTTHAVASLERAGLVERRRCPDDGRGQLATLTDAGQATLVDAAPGHVAEVRRRVFDRLSREQVAALTDACTTLIAAEVDEPGPCDG